jgi:hypothetical protein
MDGAKTISQSQNVVGGGALYVTAFVLLNFIHFIYFHTSCHVITD